MKLYVRPLWLSGLGVLLQSKGRPAGLPVRAHAWVAGSGMEERQPIDVLALVSLSLSPSLPLSIKINKIFFKNLYVRRRKAWKETRQTKGELKCVCVGGGPELMQWKRAG